MRDLNPIDSLGYSPLARCLLSNQYEAAFKLLSRGANIDIQNLDGRTALTLLIIEEHVYGAVFLLSKGANPHIVDYKDKDSCDYAKDNPIFDGI